MTDWIPFVELEFAHALGPAEGRYLVHDGEDVDGSERVAGADDADVLQLRVVGAPPTRRGVVLRRSRKLDDDHEPKPLAVLRASWLGASQATGDQGEARARLDRLKAQEDEREDLVAAVVELLNLAIRAHRAAARDPYAAEVTRADPRGIVLGYGSAEQLAAGRWARAFAPPDPRRRKLDHVVRLGPQEAVAQALAGRLDILASEEQAQRVLLDLEQDRPRSAALQLRSCTELLVSELREAEGEVAAARTRVGALVPEAADLAAAALKGPLSAEQQDAVHALLVEVDEVLAGWRAPTTAPVTR